MYPIIFQYCCFTLKKLRNPNLLKNFPYKNDSEAATEILHELFPALTSLVAIIQLYYHLDPPKYGVIYNQMVTYITETNTVARQRKSRRLISDESEEKGSKVS